MNWTKMKINWTALGFSSFLGFMGALFTFGDNLTQGGTVILEQPQLSYIGIPMWIISGFVFALSFREIFSKR